MSRKVIIEYVFMGSAKVNSCEYHKNCSVRSATRVLEGRTFNFMLNALVNSVCSLILLNMARVSRFTFFGQCLCTSFGANRFTSRPVRAIVFDYVGGNMNTISCIFDGKHWFQFAVRVSLVWVSPQS